MRKLRFIPALFFVMSHVSCLVCRSGFVVNGWGGRMC